MRRHSSRVARALFFFGLLMCLRAVAAATALVPGAEVFGALPMAENPRLSPDGRWLALLDHSEPKPKILMFDMEARKVQRVLAIPEIADVRFLMWHNNETLIIALSETTDAASSTQTSRTSLRFIAHDVSGGNGRMLPMEHSERDGADHSKDKARLADLVTARTSKPFAVMMAVRGMSSDPAASCLVEVDSRTGSPTVVKVGGAHTMRWFVDHHGQPVAREDWDFFHHEYRVYALRGDSIREILHSDDARRPRIGGVLAGDAALLLLAVNGGSHLRAWSLPLDGSPSELLVDARDEDIAAVFSDPETGTVVGVRQGGEGPLQLHWLDPTLRTRFDSLMRAFPNHAVEIYDWTVDRGKTLARVSSPNDPPVYYLTDSKIHRADIAAEEYPRLAGVPLGEFREISYQARDGTKILAYLTTPPGTTTSRLPLVVFPHDGPNERDYPLFDWFGQFLATRGYAVLQPQFRGSSGFGEEFEKAGYRQWGGLMQDDLSDGVRALVAQGIADPRRVCIIGNGSGGYSGYAALAGAAFTPDVYACAVSINGISDLQALMKEEVPRYGDATSASQSVWKERIGGPNDSSLHTKSPINAVSSIRAPVMIMYGVSVIPKDQSLSMARALNRAGKSVKVVELPTDTKWWVRTSSRVQVLQETESFLARSLQLN